MSKTWFNSLSNEKTDSKDDLTEIYVVNQRNAEINLLIDEKLVNILQGNKL